MSTRTSNANSAIEFQTITLNGKPEYAVLPYNDFLRLIEPNENIPHEVVGLVVKEGYSLPRAWREHLGMTQAQVARRMKMSQAALSQIEAPGNKLRKSTLKALAVALDVHEEQLAE